MTTLKINRLAIIALLFMSSCDLIDYHPYDLRTDVMTINADNISRIEKNTQDKDTIRFAFIGDTQRALNETEEFVNLINQNDSIDFIIHGGDLTDFGLKKEYEWSVDILSKLNKPYVALIGNHDIIANGDLVFRKIFGNDNFSFRTKNIFFLCLNTNALEYDYSNPTPNFSFIRGQKEKLPEDIKQTIVVMHAPPGDEQFNNDIKEVFHEKIKEFPSLEFCLHAHTHNFSTRDLFNDGVFYYGCDNLAKKTYMIFTITPNSYSYEIVEF